MKIVKRLNKAYCQYLGISITTELSEGYQRATRGLSQGYQRSLSQGCKGGVFRVTHP